MNWPHWSVRRVAVALYQDENEPQSQWISFAWFMRSGRVQIARPSWTTTWDNMSHEMQRMYARAASRLLDAVGYRHPEEVLNSHHLHLLAGNAHPRSPKP